MLVEKHKLPCSTEKEAEGWGGMSAEQAAVSY